MAAARRLMSTPRRFGVAAVTIVVAVAVSISKTDEQFYLNLLIFGGAVVECSRTKLKIHHNRLTLDTTDNRPSWHWCVEGSTYRG